MVAIMRDDGYVDITPDFPYEIDKVFSNNRIRLKNSPRIYRSGSFEIFHNGEKISFEKAYKVYRINCFKAKLGMK